MWPIWCMWCMWWVAHAVAEDGELSGGFNVPIILDETRRYSKIKTGRLSLFD
jgi:hypothetical protein